MNVTWMLIRGSGFVAFLALSAVTLWGLVISLGVLPRSVKRLTLVHESLSVVALAATMVHMVALVFDEFIEFDVASVLVPGLSAWEPFAVALGIVTFYGLVLVTVSFYVRRRIGQAQWRMLHYLGFGVFAGALFHGVAAGTDSSHPVVWGTYLATGAAVVALTTLRIVTAGSGKPAKSAPSGARPTPAATGTPSAAPTEDRAAQRRAAIAAAKAQAAQSPATPASDVATGQIDANGGPVAEDRSERRRRAISAAKEQVAATSTEAANNGAVEETSSDPTHEMDPAHRGAGEAASVS